MQANPAEGSLLDAHGRRERFHFSLHDHVTCMQPARWHSSHHQHLPHPVSGLESPDIPRASCMSPWGFSGPRAMLSAHTPQEQPQRVSEALGSPPPMGHLGRSTLSQSLCPQRRSARFTPFVAFLLFPSPLPLPPRASWGHHPNKSLESNPCVGVLFGGAPPDHWTAFALSRRTDGAARRGATSLLGGGGNGAELPLTLVFLPPRPIGWPARPSHSLAGNANWPGACHSTRWHCYVTVNP